MSSSPEQVTVYRKDYRAPSYRIPEVELRFEIGAETTRVHSKLKLRRDGEDAPLILHGQALDLVSIHLDGTELGESDYSRTEDELTIHRLPAECELSIVVDNHPATNSALEGLYCSGEFLLTQCEAEGFRKITYFQDRPDVMARYRVRIEADKKKYPVLLSNGNLSESGELPEGKHFSVWEDPFPKPSYLFALVAGDLQHSEDTFRTMEGRDVALRIYVEAQNIHKVAHAMESLKKSMKWDEDRFGLAYDLDVYNIVATDDFNMGAMENKSLNIFNSKYVLANTETATDYDFQGIEAVIGHEYFHNWTGNRVTCRDWFQLSLKEGLTVFRDQEFSADMQSRAVKRIEDVRNLRQRQFAEDASAMAHSIRPDSFVEINNFYTSTVYEKGAEVVRMYHTLLGEEGFQKGMKLYFERHDGQAATCDDFRSAMADANGADLEQFERWYLQAGTPVVSVSREYDEDKKEYRLTFAQETPPTLGQTEKCPQHIPIRLGLLGQDGEELALELADSGLGGNADTVELRENEQTFVFRNVKEKPIPSLFRGFSAPVKVRIEYSQEELAVLMAKDSDSFNRWDASQMLSEGILMRMVADAEHSIPQSYFDSVASLLNDTTADAGLLAESLGLPEEPTLAGRMHDRGQVADVDGIHRARTRLQAEVAQAHKGLFESRYAQRSTGEYSLDPEAIGRRSLANSCLGYLCAAGDFSHADSQFADATNMTDSVAALCALVHGGAPSAAAALAEFHERWKGDTLVMDKWLLVQATDPQPGALERIDALLSHSAFNIRNPNRVYSLIRAFGSANQVHFHAKDGSGYRWMADRVAEIDSFNPQVGARLVRSFDSWQMVDAKRQELAAEQLRRLAEGTLSNDVREIVSKTLAAKGS